MIIAGGCFVFLILVSLVTCSFLRSSSTNDTFCGSLFFSSYLKQMKLYSVSNNENIILSFVPFVFSLSSPNNFESVKKIHKNVATINSFYDDFEGGTYRLKDNEISPKGKWKGIYTGSGSMGVTIATIKSGNKNNYFFEQPKTPIYSNETRASLAITTKTFSDFQMKLKMKTVMQLRKNSPPNPWETAWVYWHYTDNFHYYALTLKTNGFQIEKKDNNRHDDSAEIYLVDVTHPRVKIGQWQTITIRHEGSSTGMPHIQVWVDGIKAADFIDNQIRNSIKMSSGYVGLYNEDSRVNFDNVNIK